MCEVDIAHSLVDVAATLVLKKAATSMRECAYVYLKMCNRFTKNLMPEKKNMQMLKRSGLTSNC